MRIPRGESWDFKAASGPRKGQLSGSTTWSLTQLRKVPRCCQQNVLTNVSVLGRAKKNHHEIMFIYFRPVKNLVKCRLFCFFKPLWWMQLICVLVISNTMVANHTPTFGKCVQQVAQHGHTTRRYDLLLKRADTSKTIGVHIHSALSMQQTSMDRWCFTKAYIYIFLYSYDLTCKMGVSEKHGYPKIA